MGIEVLFDDYDDGSPRATATGSIWPKGKTIHFETFLQEDGSLLIKRLERSMSEVGWLARIQAKDSTFLIKPSGAITVCTYRHVKSKLDEREAIRAKNFNEAMDIMANAQKPTIEKQREVTLNNRELTDNLLQWFEKARVGTSSECVNSIEGRRMQQKDSEHLNGITEKLLNVVEFELSDFLWTASDITRQQGAPLAR